MGIPIERQGHYFATLLSQLGLGLHTVPNGSSFHLTHIQAPLSKTLATSLFCWLNPKLKRKQAAPLPGISP